MCRQRFPLGGGAEHPGRCREVEPEIARTGRHGLPVDVLDAAVLQQSQVRVGNRGLAASAKAVVPTGPVQSRHGVDVRLLREDDLGLVRPELTFLVPFRHGHVGEPVRQAEAPE